MIVCHLFKFRFLGGSQRQKVSEQLACMGDFVPPAANRIWPLLFVTRKLFLLVKLHSPRIILHKLYLLPYAANKVSGKLLAARHCLMKVMA